MSQRIGQVHLSGQPVGVIGEQGNKLSFKYLTEWLSNKNAVPISLTLPLRAEPYETEGLHPFFENLLPEGWLLDVSSKKLKLIEMQKFYRLMLFSWWMANGDMHMKKFSLITDEAGICKLSPAYDLVCTELVIPGDTLAMPIGGRDKNLTRRKWLNFAEYCEIPKRPAERQISKQIDALAPSIELISRSFLSEEMKEKYEETIRANTAVLNG